jgi:hypothetical protein
MFRPNLVGTGSPCGKVFSLACTLCFIVLQRRVDTQTPNSIRLGLWVLKSISDVSYIVTEENLYASAAYTNYKRGRRRQVIQNNVHAFSLKYETICHVTPEDCDQNVCHQIISDSESLLTDDKTLKLSVSHRKFLREKLRKAIIQIRTILQEAVAYDPSQLLNTATKTKSIQCFFNRRQPDSTVSRHSLDNKEHPD